MLDIKGALQAKECHDDWLAEIDQWHRLDLYVCGPVSLNIPITGQLQTIDSAKFHELKLTRRNDYVQIENIYIYIYKRTVFYFLTISCTYTTTAPQVSRYENCFCLSLYVLGWISSFPPSLLSSSASCWTFCTFAWNILRVFKKLEFQPWNCTIYWLRPWKRPKKKSFI